MKSTIHDQTGFQVLGIKKVLFRLVLMETVNDTETTALHGYGKRHRVQPKKKKYNMLAA